jgi:tetratricopeptide (TPR) repeat protein
MISQTSIKHRLLFAASLTLLLQSSTLAASESNTQALTVKAVSLFREGKLQEAVDLEEKLTREAPKDGLSHAMLSFLYWQQGNAPDAVVEGQKAVRYSPSNEMALLNLAHMHQSLQSYADAIAMYEAAQKVAPENWVAPVCLSRCYAKTDQSAKALEVLTEMSKRPSKNFEWNFQLGNAYMVLDKPALAVPPLKIAAAAAVTPEEKSAVTNQLFLALLKDNQTSEASSMRDRVFNECQPKNPEIYAWAATSLLDPKDPDAGTRLLKSAVDNLGAIADSDVFFRLGKIFQQKGLDASTDAKLLNGWLDDAESAFNQAIDLNPGLASYHLALAGVLSRKGSVDAVRDALLQSRTFDRFDPLAPYLVSSFLGDSGSEKSTRKEQATITHAAPQYDLRAVNFKVNGLTCGCQVSKIVDAFKRIKAVAFVQVSGLKPYAGTILVDQSQTPVKDVFAQCPELAFGTTPLKEPVSFETVSEEKVTTLDQAVRITLNAKFGNVLEFPKPFDLLPPVVPVLANAE